MQEEVKKHTKKIFKIAKNPKYSYSQKAKEVLVEVLIIVFAVSISIYLHGWSAHRHEQEEVKEFLTTLRGDLARDIKLLNVDKKKYIELAQEYDSLLNMTPSQLDRLEKEGVQLEVPLYFFGAKINTGNYEGFKTSGKIGFIENKKLKKLILTYYQGLIPYIVDVDKVHNDLCFKIMEYNAVNADKSYKELFLSPQLRKRVGFIKMLGKNSIRIYDDVGIKHAAEIIREIDTELQN